MNNNLIKNDKWPTVVALTLVGVALLYRLILLYILPNVLHADHTVVALMGKHIFEQGNFPIFFYGQNWFGTIESFLDAFYFLLFGVSALSIKFAPLTFYILFMLLTYLLAADLFNKKVALWSLAWCVFPVTYLLDFSMNPQGGYIETPCLGTLLFLLSVRLIKTKSEKMRVFLYFAVGFCAGFSWWVSPLTIYYLLSAALFILLAERGKIFFWRGGIALLGTFLGSFLFWYYQWIHGHGLEGFTGGFKWERLWTGLYMMFVHDLPVLLDATRWGQINRIFFWLILIFFASSFISIMAYSYRDLFALFSWRKKDINGRSILIVFFVCVCLIYCTSELGHRGIVRYLLVFFALIPIMVGVLLNWLARFWRYLPLVVLCFLASFHIPILINDYIKVAPRIQELHNSFVHVAEKLIEEDVREGYGSYHIAGKLTYLSGEKLIVSTPLADRYKPYEERLERSDNPAFIFKGEGNIFEALSYLGGKYTKKEIGSMTYYLQKDAPKGQYHQIAPTDWKARASEETERAHYAFDRIIDQIWSSGIAQKPGMTYDLDLGRVYRLGKIYVMNAPSHYKNYPVKFKIDVSMDGQKWHTVSKSDSFQYYYWSGPRLYPWNQSFRWELRFDPREARYIRMHSLGSDEHHPWEMSEIFVYEARGEGSDAYQGVNELIQYIRRNDFERVYAPRWLSAKIKEKLGPQIKTQESYSDPLFKRGRVPDPVIQFSPKVAFVFLDEDAHIFEKLMMDYQIESQAFGPYRIYFYSEWTEAHELLLGKDQSYLWTGFSLLDTRLTLRSSVYVEYAKSLARKRLLQEALRFIQKALSFDPSHLDARRSYADLLKRLGRKEESHREWEKIYTDTIPQVSAYCHFKEGLEYLGHSIHTQDSQNNIRPGDTVEIDYFWRIDRVPSREWSVFVHFEGQGKLFQNDHRLLEQLYGRLEYRIGDIIVERYPLTIPEDCPPGSYKIGIGVFEFESNERKKIKQTRLNHRKGKVTIGQLIVK